MMPELRRMFTILLLLLLATPTLHARLGETKEQCAARYGNGEKPKIEGKIGSFDYQVYEFKGFIVSILYGSDQKAGLIAFAKLNKSHPVYKMKLAEAKAKLLDVTRENFGKSQLKENEIKTLLDSNGGFANWEWEKTNNLKEWDNALDKKQIEEIKWKRKDPVTGAYTATATYFNLITTCMLELRSPAFASFDWEKAKASVPAQPPAKEDNSLKGF